MARPPCRKPQWWISGESTDSELQRGIDLFAGKSEITEGRSDLRERVDSVASGDMRLSNAAVLRKASPAVRRELRWPRLAAGTSVLVR
jgi:hypothetical protein